MTDWLTELRLISADCTWVNEEDLIATRVIHGCHSKWAMGKVFAEHPDTTPGFDLVLRLLLAEEISRTRIKQLTTAGQLQAGDTKVLIEFRADCGSDITMMGYDTYRTL